MIKINKFTGSKGILKLEQILDKRRIMQNTNTSIVSKILIIIEKIKYIIRLNFSFLSKIFSI